MIDRIDCGSDKVVLNLRGILDGQGTAAIREGLEGIGRTAGNATSTIPTDTLLQFDSRTRWGGDAF